MDIPDKCANCEHAVVRFEDVHDGWCEYHLDAVTRCDCDPLEHPVGCVCAEVYCIKKEVFND